MRGNVIIEGKKIAFQDIFEGMAFPELTDSGKATKLLEFISEWFRGRELFDLQTSGSTGIPSRLRVHREDMALSAQMTASFLGLEAGMKALHCLPIDFIAGKMMAVRAIVSDMDLLVVNNSSRPFEGLKIQPDFIALTPFQLSKSLKKDKERDILRKTGIAIIGGAPVNRNDAVEISKWNNSIYHTFGMTESLSHIAMRLLSRGGEEDFRLISELFSISTGAEGLLHIKSPFRHARELESRDIVEITGARSFRWLGRADNVINSGGIKVRPESIEDKLAGLINAPFFISSLPDEELGQRIILLIEGPLPPEAEIVKLTNKMRKVIESKHLVPKEIRYLERFAYAPGGKISRKESTKLIK